MKIGNMDINKPGSVVWVQLSNRRWWPGTVKSSDECPLQYLQELKKDPLAIVKFFNEDKLHHITKKEQIYSYDCTRKIDFIKKGLGNLKEKDLLIKFEEDVVIAEKLTGGNMQIIEELKQKDNGKKKDFYSRIGFGGTEAKIPIITKVESHQKRGFSDIGEAILYKRTNTPSDQPKFIEHVSKVLEQKPRLENEVKQELNFYKCSYCGFTCCRLTVIVWHNKAHLKKVDDYDSGIRIPGRRKRKPNSQKNKDKKRKAISSTEHSHTNGHISPKNNSQEAKQLLLDWEEEDEMKELPNGTEETNGIDGSFQEEEDSDNVNSEDDGYDDNYPPPQPRRERQPMPRQDDINSAFDALLADSSPLHNSTSNHSSSYVNNDSDSEGSDWEKYYDKSSGSETSVAKEQINKFISNGIKATNENGRNSQEDLNLLEGSDLDANAKKETFVEDQCLSTPSTSQAKYSSSSKLKAKRTYGTSKLITKIEKKEKSIIKDEKREQRLSNDEKESMLSGQTSLKKIPGSIPVKSRAESADDLSSQSSSNSSTSSGPAYMLVAVDAQGNNVPMPVLSEGGNHLVAVEASMEDGTTRTLYIDPAHLGPNVDLNNLMLHIDNSGQETVIIPTSNSDGEIISPTLIDQGSQESSNRKINDGHAKSGKSTIEETGKKRHGSVQEEKCAKAITSSGEIKLSKFRKSKQLKSKTKVKDADPTLENKIIEEEEDEDVDELPDYSLENIFDESEPYSPDELVWALTHGNWWPSFVVKVYFKEGKASILYINCQQSVPLKVSLSKLKPFLYSDYPDIFAAQKDKASGLTEAMQMAYDFKKLKEENIMKETPREFFNLPISEQRTLINKMTLVKRGVPLDLESLLPSSSTENIYKSSSPTHEDETESDSEPIKNIHSPENTPVSDDKLSEREKYKLDLSLKSRRIKNESFISFIQSEACLQHLRGIISESVDSERHSDFMRFRHQQQYYSEMNSRYNPGFDFFGINDIKQTQQVIMYLEKQFLDRHLGFLLDQPQRRMYIKLVLFPEAIKHSVRNVAKSSENDLEEILATGLYQTPTEKKAMRLEYEDFRF